MSRTLLCDISVDKDNARFGGGDDRLWHSGIGTTYPKRLKRKCKLWKSSVEEGTNMRCLGVSGWFREKIRICLKICCPFSVGLKQCLSIVVVNHSVVKDCVAKLDSYCRLGIQRDDWRSEGSGTRRPPIVYVRLSKNEKSGKLREWTWDSQVLLLHDVPVVFPTFTWLNFSQIRQLNW